MNEFREFISPYFDSVNPLIAVVLCLIALFVGFLVHFIAFRIISRFSSRRPSALWPALLKHGKTSSLFLILLICFIAVKPLMHIVPDSIASVNHAMAIITVVIVAWNLVQAVTIIRVSLLNRFSIDADDNLKARKVHTQFKMLGNIVKFLIIVLAIGIGLMTFESIRHFGVSLLASAGIAGIILGFAAQKLIATVLAGLQLAITQPIRLDDVVIVEGEWGKIEEMTLTYVVVCIWDKRRLIVPTTFFIDNPFQNWTRVSADILGTVFLYTDYAVPVDKIREELTRILHESSHWDGLVNVVQVTDAREHTMEIRALVSAVDAGTAFDLRVEVREKLISFLQKNYPESLPRTRIEFNNSVKPSAEVSVHNSF